VRHLDARHAAVHQDLDIDHGIQARPPDRRDTDGIGGDAHQFDVGGRQRAMLAVEQHPIKTGEAEHLNELR